MRSRNIREVELVTVGNGKPELFSDREERREPSFTRLGRGS
jgi:hypothetical protein